jgi:hypothetical protein
MSAGSHVEIADNDLLWRRLTAEQWIKSTPEGRRVSSAAFKNNAEDEVLSVHLARLTTIENVFLAPPVCLAVAEISAGVPRGLGHRVIHSPTEDDWSHASITPPPGYRSSKKKSDAKLMALSARLIDSP